MENRSRNGSPNTEMTRSRSARSWIIAGFSHDYDISAYAFFAREEREVKQAIDAAVDILGMRYGYPDDAPQDDENSDNDHIDEDIQASDMAAEDMEDNTEEDW